MLRLAALLQQGRAAPRSAAGVRPWRWCGHHLCTAPAQVRARIMLLLPLLLLKLLLPIRVPRSGALLWPQANGHRCAGGRGGGCGRGALRRPLVKRPEPDGPVELVICALRVRSDAHAGAA